MTIETSIGRVLAGLTNAGDIAGVITATTGTIQEVSTIRGSVTAPVTADKRIDTVHARDHITAAVTSTTAQVNSVTTDTGSVAAVSGPTGIGRVWAASNIAGDITASAGLIGLVFAGGDKFGNIAGAISAGANIFHVYAAGVVLDPRDPNTGSGMGGFDTSFLQYLNDPMADPETLSKPNRQEGIGKSSNGGDIVGAIDAGGTIGLVAADGSITGDITAAQQVRAVWARDDIEADITSASGATSVTAWGEMSGQVNANDHVRVDSYDDLSGNVTSAVGTALANTWASLKGSVDGYLGVVAAGYDAITSPTISSDQGYAGVFGYDNVKTAVDSKATSAIGVLGQFSGEVVSHDGDVAMAAIRNIDVKINSHGSAAVATMMDIRASITAGGEAALFGIDSPYLRVDAVDDFSAFFKGQVSGDKIISSSGDIYIEAGTVSVTEIDAQQGRVGVWVYGMTKTEGTGSDKKVVYDNDNGPGNVNSKISAEKDIVVFASGGLNGDILSRNGRAWLTVGNIEGDIAESVTADDGVSIVCWGETQGELVSENGPISVFSYGDIMKTVNAGGDVDLTTWGSVLDEVTAGGDVKIFARNDVMKAVTADHDATVVANGSIFGDVIAGNGDTGGQYSAVVVARHDVQASVTASGDASVSSMATVTGDVTAHAGSAKVSALISFEGNVDAGVDATIVTGGSLGGTIVEAGNDVKISAHGSIQTPRIEAGRNVSIFTDTTLTGDAAKPIKAATGFVTIGALEAIATVTVEARQNVDVFSGGAAGFTKITSTSGSIAVTAIGDISGDHDAGKNLTLNSYKEISVGDVTAKTGSMALVADTDLTVLAAAANTNLTAIALDNVGGSYTSQGPAGVFAGENYNGTTDARQAATVMAGLTLDGSVTSRQGTATVVSYGPAPSDGYMGDPSPGSTDVSANVSAHRDANISAYQESVTGTVTAILGDATVAADNQITKVISAGADAVVSAIGDISSPTITGGAHAFVISLATISSQVEAQSGSAAAIAGTGITGAVTGALNVTALTKTGDIALTADVNATNGSAAAIAGGSVFADVTAGQHALAAALDNVHGKVTATTGNAVAVAGADVTGDVDATVGAATVIAMGSLLGNVTAGGDAFVATLQNQSGAVSAGNDALAIVGGDSWTGHRRPKRRRAGPRKRHRPLDRHRRNGLCHYLG